MANSLKKEFGQFHETIKLNDIDDNKELREKRDMLTQELRKYFDKKSIAEQKPKITFSIENQGSYSMGTGISPLDDEDYDIDIMILFNISKDDYSPIEVKKWVYEALNISFRTVEYKNPCVRVQYYKNQKKYFHVDLALYSNSNSDGKIYLSRGRPTSKDEDKKWEISEPKKLKEKINNLFSDSDDRQQMKRVIRYLKRWKDFKFKNTGNGKPNGIALTSLAYNLFSPNIERNSFDSSVSPKDLKALKSLVSKIIGEFSFFSGRIRTELPVEPYNDLFEKLSDNQCAIFKDKLIKLEKSLDDAEEEPDTHEASKILIKEFGSDFPEIDKEKSAQKRNLAFPGKSESA